MPSHVKKEEFIDKKLNDFIKLPIEHHREELIFEQEKILISLNLSNKFIMNLVRLEFEKMILLENLTCKKQKKHYEDVQRIPNLS